MFSKLLVSSSLPFFFLTAVLFFHMLKFESKLTSFIFSDMSVSSTRWLRRQIFTKEYTENFTILPSKEEKY